MKVYFLNPKLSVVVLTHNRRDEIMGTVASLLRLPERPEIVVVDNGSTDGSSQLLANTYPGLRVIRSDVNLGAAARNLGVAYVRTPYVAFSDDDTDWQAGSLARAVELLDRHPRIGVLNARVVVGERRVLDPTCALMASSPLGHAAHPLPRLVGFMAGACVFRTALFESLGGYEPRLFIGGEEALLSLDVLQTGHDIAYAEELEVHHRPSLKRDSGLRRRMIARNEALVAWLRLPRTHACASTLRAAVNACGGKHVIRDLRDLYRGITWAIGVRRPVTSRVLQMRAQVREWERSMAPSSEPAIDPENCGDPMMDRP